MNTPEFVAKWKSSTLTERASAQSWFNNLCQVLDQPTPTDLDVDGDAYTFERGATKTGGGNGWADVWMRGHFAWEFKGKHADLTKAYKQLKDYTDALDNPPLLRDGGGRPRRSAIGPTFSGMLLNISTFGWPLVIAGSLKVVYDLTLL